MGLQWLWAKAGTGTQVFSILETCPNHPSIVARTSALSPPHQHMLSGTCICAQVMHILLNIFSLSYLCISSEEGGPKMPRYMAGTEVHKDKQNATLSFYATPRIGSKKRLDLTGVSVNHSDILYLKHCLEHNLTVLSTICHKALVYSPTFFSCKFWVTHMTHDRYLLSSFFCREWRSFKCVW